MLAVQDIRWREGGWGVKPILWAFPIYPASSFFLSLPPFPSILVCLCQSVFPTLLSLFPSIRISNPPNLPHLPRTSAIFTLTHLSKNLPIFLNPWTPSCPPFHPTLIVLCVIFSPSPIHFEFSPFFANSLQSHYLSPSIVLVVDYVIRAEDMSFLPTRSSAQWDYTKPFSLLSFFFSLTQTHRSKHTHKPMNMVSWTHKCTKQVCLTPFPFLILCRHATSSTYTNMGYSMQTLKLLRFESGGRFPEPSWPTQSSWCSWAGSPACHKYPTPNIHHFTGIQPRSMKEKYTTDLVPLFNSPHHYCVSNLAWVDLLIQIRIIGRI